MIIFRLSDGLGNQLFQYAASVALERRTGARISYLLDFFHSRRARGDRPLLLHRFIDGVEAQYLPSNGFTSRYGQLVCRLLTPPSDSVRHISGVCHLTARAGPTPRFEQCTDGMTIAGFFQSERCFAEVRDEVCARLDKGIGRRIASMRDAERNRAHGRRRAALHIRVGDYRSIGNGSEAIVPLHRVRNAVAALSPQTELLCFTDSPDEVRALDFGRPFKFAAGLDPIDDFCAMAACDDFIIANSTYSWWASYLGKAPDKQIWAPADWSRPGRSGGGAPEGIYLDSHILY